MGRRVTADGAPGNGGCAGVDLGAVMQYVARGLAVGELNADASMFGGFRVAPHTYSHRHEAPRHSQRFGGGYADRLDADERRSRDRPARAVVAG